MKIQQQMNAISGEICMAISIDPAEIMERHLLSMVLEKIADKISDAYIAEHYQEIVAAISPEEEVKETPLPFTSPPAPSGETLGTCDYQPEPHPYGRDTTEPNSPTTACFNWKPVAPEATSYSHDIGGCCGYVIDWHGNDPVLCFLKPQHEEKEHMGQLILRKVAPEAVGTKEPELEILRPCKCGHGWGLHGPGGCNESLCRCEEFRPVVGRETREQVEQEIIIECSSDIEHIIERRFSTGYRTVINSVWNALINARVELSTLSKLTVTYIAKLESQVRELTAQVKAHRESDQDRDRLVRELDHALFGPTTARQARLCDLAKTVPRLVAELRATIERLEGERG